VKQRAHALERRKTMATVHESGCIGSGYGLCPGKRNGGCHCACHGYGRWKHSGFCTDRCKECICECHISFRKQKVRMRKKKRVRFSTSVHKGRCGGFGKCLIVNCVCECHVMGAWDHIGKCKDYCNGLNKCECNCHLSADQDDKQRSQKRQRKEKEENEKKEKEEEKKTQKTEWMIASFRGGNEQVVRLDGIFSNHDKACEKIEELKKNMGSTRGWVGAFEGDDAIWKKGDKYILLEEKIVDE
jgi:hypothetical protein